MAYLLVKERRHAHLVLSQRLQIRALLWRHANPSTAQPPAIHAGKELAHHALLTDSLLDNHVIAAKLKLVPEIRQSSRVNQLLDRVILILHFEVRRGDAEDVRDQIRVELRHAVDDCTTPVVPTEDELRRVDAFGQVGDEVCVVLEGVVMQIGREALCTSLAIEWTKIDNID